MKDEILTFYREQSAITRPGKHSALFTDLPQSIEALCKIVQGLIIHYDCGDLYGCQIPAEREREMDTRYIEHMLERILKRDPHSLSEARVPELRLVGCCRDFSTMLCSMLRSQGIPARIRMGFASYIDVGPGFSIDHVVVEYWHEGEGRWRMVDPQMDALLIKINGIDFDVQNIPAGRSRQAARPGGAVARARQTPIPLAYILRTKRSVAGGWYVTSWCRTLRPSTGLRCFVGTRGA